MTVLYKTSDLVLTFFFKIELTSFFLQLFPTLQHLCLPAYLAMKILLFFPFCWSHLPVISKNSCWAAHQPVLIHIFPVANTFFGLHKIYIGTTLIKCTDIKADCSCYRTISIGLDKRENLIIIGISSSKLTKSSKNWDT